MEGQAGELGSCVCAWTCLDAQVFKQLLRVLTPGHVLSGLGFKKNPRRLFVEIALLDLTQPSGCSTGLSITDVANRCVDQAVCFLAVGRIERDPLQQTTCIPSLEAAWPTNRSRSMLSPRPASNSRLPYSLIDILRVGCLNLNRRAKYLRIMTGSSWEDCCGGKGMGRTFRR